MQDVIKLGSIEASIQAEKTHKFDSDSNELKFTICVIMEHYQKCLPKIKKTSQVKLKPLAKYLWINGCLHHRLFHTPVNDWWVL